VPDDVFLGYISPAVMPPGAYDVDRLVALARFSVEVGGFDGRAGRPGIGLRHSRSRRRAAGCESRQTMSAQICMGGYYTRLKWK
jgi:hypothetical protein